VLAERQLSAQTDGFRQTTAFFRAGIATGDTTPFRESMQAGLTMSRVFGGRPDSVVSLGVHYVGLTRKGRDNLSDAGASPARAETGLEVTYADGLTSWLTIQPNLQVVWMPGGDRNADPAIVLGMRFTITPGP
jgi:porin